MNAGKLVAIVHEWFVTYAGSERVVERILNVFPQAGLFALVDFVQDDERGFLGGRQVHTSFIQRLPKPPPVDTERFALRTDKEDFYLAASRMVPYKRMPIIVEAFATMPDKQPAGVMFSS